MSNLKAGATMKRITSALASLTVEVELHNSRGRTDINKDAEDFYCGLLNIVLSKKLKNMNLLNMNFPAIDLADKRGKLCVQVTSINKRDKIEKTLEKFYEGTLDGTSLTRHFNRLIVLIIGEKLNYRKPFDERDGFRFDSQNDIWDRKRLLEEIERLPSKKLKAVDVYLHENLEHYHPSTSEIHLPPQTALVDEKFVGREKELQVINNLFKKQQFVILSGLGGIGKTELAVRFARKYWEGNTYFVRFVTSWKQTVLDYIAPKIQKLEQKPDKADQVYQAVMQELEKCSEQELLIVDNANQIKGSAELYSALSSLRMKVLITTRVEISEAIPIREMENKELYRIFERHGAKLDVFDTEHLIKAVNGHTMTVDLLARTLASKWCRVSVEAIIEAMKNSTMEQNDYPVIDADYASNPEQPKIYGYLHALFQLHGLRDADRYILACATLLPVNGMSKNIFVNAISEEKRTAIELVSASGWIQCENELITIHPVVRLVCHKELRPTDEICKNFLDAVWLQYNPKNYDKEIYRQFAELFHVASKKLMDQEGIWSLRAGLFWECLGKYDKALDCYLKTLDCQDANRAKSIDIARTYIKIGSAYLAMGKLEEALKSFLKAKKITEKRTEEEPYLLATILSNLGGVYSDLGDYTNALKYRKESLNILEDLYPERHPALAKAYSNLGSVYSDRGDYETSLSCYLKALEIREDQRSSDFDADLDLARTYNNVGGNYLRLQDYSKAQKYLLKTLMIRERLLPDGHPDLIRSYNNMGGLYILMGDDQKALECLKKALKHREQVPLEDYLGLATIYNNIAALHTKQGEFEVGLKYLLDALDLQGKVYPKDRPDIAHTNGNIAWTYYHLGRLDEAAAHMRRAAEIINRSSIPEDHPDRVNYNKWSNRFEEEARLNATV